MKKAKLIKFISCTLAVLLLATMMSVISFAAAPVEIKVVKGPNRTVFYEGADTVFESSTCSCAPEGMILEVKYSDGTSKQVKSTFKNTTIYASRYTLGKETDAVVTYEGLTTTVKVTIQENPIKSLKVIKLPNKTEYYMDRDVMTRGNFNFDKIVKSYPGYFDSALQEKKMTFEEYKAYYQASPERMNAFLDNYYKYNHKSLLMIDRTGMKVLITYKDGTTETISDGNFNTYKGQRFPIYIIPNNQTVEEGENKFILIVMGVTTSFDVTVKKNAPPEYEKSTVSEKVSGTQNATLPGKPTVSVQTAVTEETFETQNTTLPEKTTENVISSEFLSESEKPAESENSKNLDRPNMTAVYVAVAAAVLAAVGGVAYILIKKRKK